MSFYVEFTEEKIDEMIAKLNYIITKCESIIAKLEKAKIQLGEADGLSRSS